MVAMALRPAEGSGPVWRSSSAGGGAPGLIRLAQRRWRIIGRGMGDTMISAYWFRV